MTNPYAQESAIFLINALFGAYCLLVMLRFLLQRVHADFNNPLSQFTIKVTQPLVRPLRRVVPGLWGMDMASLTLLYLLNLLQVLLIFLAAGQSFSAGNVFALALTDSLALVLDVYVATILIEVILSWLGPTQRHDILRLLMQLNAPVLGWFRRYVPPLAGMDFSPFIALIVIHLMKILFLAPLMQWGAS